LWVKQPKKVLYVCFTLWHRIILYNSQTCLTYWEQISRSCLKFHVKVPILLHYILTCLQRESVPTVPTNEGGVEAHTESPHPNGRSLSPMFGVEPKGMSPEASSTASDSPTPTNSVQERNWAATTHWHGLGKLLLLISF